MKKTYNKKKGANRWITSRNLTSSLFLALIVAVMNVIIAFGGEDPSDLYGYGAGLTGVGYNIIYDASQTAAGARRGLGYGGTTASGDGGGTFSSSMIVPLNETDMFKQLLFNGYNKKV